MEASSLDMTLVLLGGGECIDDQLGGCMDTIYDNYDPNATFDNGSGVLTLAIMQLLHSTLQLRKMHQHQDGLMLVLDVDGNGAEVTFSETASAADVNYIIGDCDSASATMFLPSSTSIYLEAGQCIYFQAVDTWNTDSVGTVTASFYAIPDSSEWGCMDEFACNYDSAATYDFGYEYPELGALIVTETFLVD